MPLARRLAGPVALIAIVGAVGWVGGPAIARGGGGLGLFGLVVAVALPVGALVYGWVEREVRRSLAPLERLGTAMKDAAARPRDHIAVLRRSLGAPLGGEAEVGLVVDAATRLFDRIEDRQARQAAWMGGLVHDVKTPVAAAANALDVLAASPAWRGSEDGALLERVGSELRGLASHVQAVLEAIRLEREDVPLETGLVDLGAMARAIAGRVETQRGVHLRVQGSAQVIGDRALLERAIENLVVNACRTARSKVSVDVFPGLLRIEDDGPGLPAPLEVLSAPFRSEPVTMTGVTLAGGSAGMGLFLARRALELHQGKLVVERSDTNGTVLLAYVGAAGRERRAG